jgi:AcrR family transcriptional regulator
MTNEDIVSAAFRVWGCTLFQKTSLSDVAAELGCTKPALYRHFRNKGKLLDAMYESCFDRMADFLESRYKEVDAEDNVDTALIALTGALGEFYLRNKGEFIFTLVKVYGSAANERRLSFQMIKRGINLTRIRSLEESTAGGGGIMHPSKTQMVTCAVLFFVSQKYFGPKPEDCGGLLPLSCELREQGDSAIMENLARNVHDLKETIARGLGFIKERVDKVNFDKLDRMVSLDAGANSEIDEIHLKLLKAIGEVIAEAGPDGASMEMFAKKSGVSKSNFYSHFESKEEMVLLLFANEFQRISNIAVLNKAKSDIPEEQFYLAVTAVAGYLRNHTIILRAIDKMRARREDFTKKRYEGKEGLFQVVVDVFGGIQVPTADGEKTFTRRDTNHVLFMLVNMLMFRPGDMDYEDVGNESIRILYRFLTLGLQAHEAG